MTITDMAWLAGLWDGEGSVGVHRTYLRKEAVYGPQIQIQMTHQPTIKRAVEIIRELGCDAVAYTWAEKKAHHKDACGFAIHRTGYVKTIADALLPYAVTKREHWDLIAEFCALRIGRMGLDEKTGRLRRGGAAGWWVPYSDREKEIIDVLRRINRRGTAADFES